MYSSALTHLAKASILFVLLVLFGGCSGGSSSNKVGSTPATTNGVISIETVSNRADLISGGDALLRLVIPQGLVFSDITIMANDRDVSNKFTPESPSRALGLIEGFEPGPVVVKATAVDGRNAVLTITNHPKGGPVFSGPQISPWLCTTVDNGLGQPLDDQCNATTQVTWLYQPEGEEDGTYEEYDPEDPPDDVAQTTTEDGRTVPYIIRLETGTFNRTIYKVMVLADPSSGWTAVNPQQVWNRKLFIAFGGGCGTQHKQMPPNEDELFGASAGNGHIKQPELLAKGWMTAATGLNTLNHNCNETVSAEAVMMLKELIVENYGEIKRTVSVGGSGGSVQQHHIAAAYPGLLDGIVPTQSFPDLWNLVWDAAECYLLNRYFLTISPFLWPLLEQQAAVTGKTGVVACAEFIALFADAFDPQNRGILQTGIAVRFGCELPPQETYHPLLNPEGTRCSVQDYQRNIWGTEGPLDAALMPFDNTGVQYGLLALQEGRITQTQFVDLNSKIGSINREGDFVASRASMAVSSAITMYRTGRNSDPTLLARVPIVDIREAISRDYPEKLADLHQPYFSHAMRARLLSVNGTHANQIFWRFPPENQDIPGALTVDRWLDAIEADKSELPLAEKVIRNKPNDIVDTCWIGDEAVTDAARCDQEYAFGTAPRIRAGAPLRDDNRKCQLKPLKREDYNVSFSNTQWQTLQSTFPQGVCDWSKPPVGYQPSIPWITFANGPGGEPLGPPPASIPNP